MKMQAENPYVSFKDAPQMAQLESVINGWHKPRWPQGLKPILPTSGKSSVVELACLAKAKVSEMQCSSYKRRLEVMLISWLYDLIRINVKRGRVFDLRQVFLQSSADCLGYAKLFTLLGLS
jgi:hypothetical protein